MACEKEGPDQHRVKAEGLQVHRRDDQVPSVLQGRHSLLHKAASIRLLPPPH